MRVARRFKLDAAADPQAQKEDAMTLRMAAALAQPAGQPTSLEELVSAPSFPFLSESFSFSLPFPSSPFTSQHTRSKSW